MAFGRQPGSSASPNAIGCGAAACDSLGCKPEVIVSGTSQAAEQRRHAAASQLSTLCSLANLWLKPQAIKGVLEELNNGNVLWMARYSPRFHAAVVDGPEFLGTDVMIACKHRHVHSEHFYFGEF